MILDRLEQMDQRFTDLQSQFALPEVLSDHERYQKIAKQLREIETPVELYRELKQVRQGLAEAREMASGSDADLRAMADAGDSFQVLREPWRQRQAAEIGRQVAPLRRFVRKRKFLRVRLEEEIEGVEHRHLGDQVDLDVEVAGAIRELQAGEVVGFRVLLPVEEMPGGRPIFQRIGQDARAAVRCRAQPDYCGSNATGRS